MAAQIEWNGATRVRRARLSAQEKKGGAREDQLLAQPLARGGESSRAASAAVEGGPFGVSSSAVTTAMKRITAASRPPDWQNTQQS